MSLYNSERPQTFADIKGQDKIVALFRGIWKSGNPVNLPNAFLFVGVRGTGKTSASRIFAKALNCEHPTEDGPCNECETCKEIAAERYIDVIELDAASHNKVEDVQRIIDQTKYQSMGKKKVFILDEVHMLTDAAWNALLKVIEEPPKDCVFIFCTTEVQKVKATIISRCRRFNFEAIDDNVIFTVLEDICKKYNRAFEPDALKLIAKASKGSLRDAESILDNFFQENVIAASKVADVLGLSEDAIVFRVLQGVAARKPKDALTGLQEAIHRGNSLQALLNSICSALKDVIFLLEGGSMETVVNTVDYKNGLTELSKMLTVERAFDLITGFSSAYEKSLRDGDLEFYIEVTILRMIQTVSEQTAVPSTTDTTNVSIPASILKDIETLQKRVMELEDCVFDGIIPEGRGTSVDEATAQTPCEPSDNNGWQTEASTPFENKPSEEESGFEDGYIPEDTTESEDVYLDTHVVHEQLDGKSATAKPQESMKAPTDSSISLSMELNSGGVSAMENALGTLNKLLPKGAIIGEGISLTGAQTEMPKTEDDVEIQNGESKTADEKPQTPAPEPNEPKKEEAKVVEEKPSKSVFDNDFFDFARQW